MDYNLLGASLNGPKIWIPDWVEAEVGVLRDFNNIKAGEYFNIYDRTGPGMSNYKPLRLPNHSQTQSKENNKMSMCRAVRKTLTTSIDALAMLATASAHAEVKSKPSPIAGVVATRDNARGTVDQIAESFPMAR